MRVCHLNCNAQKKLKYQKNKNVSSDIMNIKIILINDPCCNKNNDVDDRQYKRHIEGYVISDVNYSENYLQGNNANKYSFENFEVALVEIVIVRLIPRQLKVSVKSV